MVWEYEGINLMHFGIVSLLSLSLSLRPSYLFSLPLFLSRGSYDNYKLSLPEVEYIIFPDFGFTCRDPRDKGIRFEYVKNISCREDILRKHGRSPTNAECDKEALARTAMQKFKLISVKVCSFGSIWICWIYLAC